MKIKLQDPHFGEEDVNPYFSTFFVPANRTADSGTAQETSINITFRKIMNVWLT